MDPSSFITPSLQRLEKVSAPLLVLYRFAEMRPLKGITSLVDWRLYGHLSNLIIDGFLDGHQGESLLMPLGGQLPQKQLLLIGLGDRDAFGKETFTGEMARAFEIARGLGHKALVVALPGRVEMACPATEAIEWFLSGYETQGGEYDVHIIEPPNAQKVMSPVVERWRLKQLMPS